MKNLKNIIYKSNILRCIFLLDLLIILVSANVCFSKESGEDEIELFINYAYSNEVGMGGFNIAGLDGRFIKLPIGYTFWLGENDRWGLRVKTTFFYGKYKFVLSESSGSTTADIDTLSAVPGLELIIPVIEKDEWSLILKPLVELGLGWKFNVDEPTGIDITLPINYIYNVGIKSLFSFYWRKFTFGIGNQISFAGNGTYDFDFNQSYGLFKNGIDIRHPLGFSIKGFAPDASVFFIHYHYLPDTEIGRIDRKDLEIDNQFEIAFTIGSDKPFKLLVVNNPRIGIGYLFGDSVKALTVNFGFPF